MPTLMGYKFFLDEDNIKNNKVYVEGFNRIHEKMEMTIYMIKLEEHFLYVLKEYVILWQEKVNKHKINPPVNLYWYFTNILKGSARNTWGIIIMNGFKTHTNLDSRHLEDLRSRVFCRNKIATQWKYLDKNPKLYKMNVI